MLEGFDSNCCMNFKGFTNPASEQRTMLHKTHFRFIVFFFNCGQGSHAVLKVLNFEISFQDLEKVLNLAKMYIKY